LLTGRPGEYWSRLLADQTNDMIIASNNVAGALRNQLVNRFLPPGRVSRARNAVEHPADEEGARLLLTEAFAWLLRKQPQRLNGPQGLVSLYRVCYGLRWDDWDNVDPNTSFFGHNFFSVDSTDRSQHAGFMGKWLDVSYYDSQYIEGLFMSNGFASIAPCKCVSAEYVRAALTRLGVTVTVEVLCEYVNLPVAPGIAFLVSLAELVTELSRDNNDSGRRPPPNRISFYCANGNQYGVRISLCGKGATTLREEVVRGVKNCGATGALANLLRAHCAEAPATEEWSPLFRADNGQAVALLDPDGGNDITITWKA
jgi:hypothetical protein